VKLSAKTRYGTRPAGFGSELWRRKRGGQRQGRWNDHTPPKNRTLYSSGWSWCHARAWSNGWTRSSTAAVDDLTGPWEFAWIKHRSHELVRVLRAVPRRLATSPGTVPIQNQNWTVSFRFFRSSAISMEVFWVH